MLMFKEILRDYIERNVNPTDVALSFSGGTDSLGLLFACLDLDIKPKLYIYTVKGFPSKDLETAVWVATKYDLQLKVVEIPDDVDTLIKDVKIMLCEGIRGKVNIQCMHGHYYVAPQVRESMILNGSGIDGIYGVYREYLLNKQARNDKTVFDILRNKHLSNPNDDAMIYQKILYQKYGVQVLYPYRHSLFVDYLMTKTWDEINRPRMKNIFVQEYQEQFDGFYRQRGSQQIIAGTRELHDKLLGTKYNTGKYKTVTPIYRVMELEL